MKYDEMKKKVESYISSCIGGGKKANYDRIISIICGVLPYRNEFEISEGNGVLTISWDSSLEFYLKNMLDRNQMPSKQSLEISVSDRNNIFVSSTIESQGLNNDIDVVKSENRIQISDSGYLVDTFFQTKSSYQLEDGNLTRDRVVIIRKYDENSIKQFEESYNFYRQKFENQHITMAFYSNWVNWKSKYEEIDDIQRIERSENFWEIDCSVERVLSYKTGKVEKKLLNATKGFLDFNTDLRTPDELSPEELESHIEYGIANTRIRNERAAKAFEEDYKKWKESTNISTKGVNKR